MYRAMIVEDELLVRIGIKSMIDWRAAGIDVVYEASNGLHAFEIYRKEKPEIIITDLKMPEMDGIELISAIRKTHGDAQTRFIVLSCVDEFPLVQQALNLGVSHYFLKVTMKCEEMQSVLCAISGELSRRSPGRADDTKSAKHLHERIRACMKEDLGPAGTKDILRELGFHESGEYTCALVHLYKADGENAASPPNAAFLSEILLRRSRDNLRIEAVYLDSGEYMVLLQPQTQDDLDSLFTGWYTDLKLYANMNAQIGFYSACGGTSLAKGAAHAGRALMGCFFSHTGQYFSSCACDTFRVHDSVFDELASIPKQYIHLPAAFVSEYRGKVGQLTRRAYPTPTAFKEALCALMIWLLKQIDCACECVEQVNVEYSRRLLACRTLGDSVLVFRKFIAEVIGTASFSKNTPATIMMVLSYINNNLSRPMSLQEIAKHAHLNASYLSTLFKKVMNCGLIDYINTCRINRAEVLLRETDCPVAQIAQSVGFSEEIYFYRLFKRFVGITPGEYRCQRQKA